MKNSCIFYTSALILSLFVNTVMAQSGFLEVYQSSPHYQEGQDVLPTSDGGYLIAGYTTTNIQYDVDVLVIKTNANGKESWRKTFGGNKPDFPYHMLQTYDGHFFLIGYSQSYGNGDFDILLLKITSAGTLLWQKTFGSYGNDIGHDIIKTSDGNYMIVATSNSQDYNDKDANLIKIDPSGTVLWSKYYGGQADDHGNSIKQTSDGGYIMIGTTFSYGAPGGDAYLVKLNSSGDTTWTKRFGGAHYDEGVYVTIASDGGYVFLVRDSSHAGKDIDISMIKTDASGNLKWNKLYGGDKKDTPKMIQKTMDGGYIIGGHSRSFGWINPDMWILKCNAGGDTIWSRHYGGYDHEHCYVVRELTNGSFIAVGKTGSYGPDFDPIFLKLTATGTITVGEHELLTDHSFAIYPNPSDGIMHVDMAGYNAEKISLTDLSGKMLFEKQVSNQQLFDLDLTGISAGVYIIRCEAVHEFRTRKIMIR